MKKFNAILILLGLSLGAFAQVPFAGINWVGWATEADFSAAPYDKPTIDAMLTKSTYAVDVAELDEITLPGVWDRLTADAGVINTHYTAPTAGTDPSGDDFKCEFKAFYDDENVYIAMKWVDAAAFSAADSRFFEIAFQTKEKDRYEAGFTASTTLAQQNAQYCRFNELGGFKAKLTNTGVTESVGTKGQTGAWGSSLNAANTFDYNYNVDGDGTLWAVIAFNYADHLMYMTNEWGAYEAANYTTFDPSAKQTVAFEIKCVCQDAGAVSNEWWWSGAVNNTYTIVWDNGYLNFSDVEWIPVGISNNLVKGDQSAFIYNDVLRFKGFDRPVNVEIYSVIGQQVRTAQNVSELNVSDLRDGIYLVKVDGVDKAFKVLK